VTGLKQVTFKELKRYFGSEYPVAVMVDGVRQPLDKETRFSRRYYSPDRKMGNQVSRFMDGSASISFDELRREWPAWAEAERMDFCGASAWLEGQSDFPDILRFIMQHSGPDEWLTIAMSVSRQLPANEAFDLCFARWISGEPVISLRQLR
jgi:hypothetical protein